MTPKLYGLELADDVRQKIYYGKALRVTPGDATDRLVMATDFTDVTDLPAVLQTVMEASRWRPPGGGLRPSRAQRGREARCGRVDPVEPW